MKSLLSASRKYLPELVERAAFFMYRNGRYSVPIAIRKARRQRMVLIVGTPHKVGSTWLFHLLRELGRFESKILPGRFMHVGTIRLDHPDLFQYITRGYGYSIYKSHSFPIANARARVLRDRVRFVTVYRDPRDVIVSASFFLSRLDPDRGGWGPAFAAMSTTDRIEALIDRGDFLIDRLEAWYRTPTAIKVCYERMIAHPTEEITAVCNELGLDCSADEIRRACEAHSFKSKSGRDPGCENASDFLRKGIAGDWQNHFDEKCVEAFKSRHGGRWNALLVEMGYEAVPDWPHSLKKPR